MGYAFFKKIEMKELHDKLVRIKVEDWVDLLKILMLNLKDSKIKVTEAQNRKKENEAQIVKISSECQKFFKLNV